MVAQAITDLIDDLTPKGDAKPNRDAHPAARLAVTTPILAGIVDQGLFHLTVELFECEGGGPFSPDLGYLGLTDIATAPNGNEGASLLEAMQEVWEMSGLATKFRGRWRIVAPPLAKQKLKDAKPVYPPRFDGRSAQAATLCALLAATGNPYGEKRSDADQQQPRVVDPLDPQVAISATVSRDESAKDSHDAKPKNPIELKLGPVAKIPQKLSSAAGPLDTFVFQTLQPDDDKKQIETLNKERAEQEKQQQSAQYKGLHIERAETIADALDLLLVTNRHLRKYQNIVRDQWLKQWENDTARFPEDTGYGPDRENQPETQEISENESTAS